MPTERMCPDCQTPMQPIRLVDATSSEVFGTEGSDHVDLEYALPDTPTKMGWKSHYVPAAGRVGAVMCPACGRIVLYAIPRDHPPEPREPS
jgi:endogenous inhibitor of DNA gyrase (YacG/DUF329 family)